MGRKKGYKHDMETKMKIAQTKKGVRVSVGTEFKKGCTAWNKGKKMERNIGKDHPSWKGGTSRYWANKVLLGSGKETGHCQICKEKTKTQIHHVNGNAKDNKIQNLGVVCSYCHFAIHDNGKSTKFQTGHQNLYFGKQTGGLS